jgi:hypothetical protein
MEENSDKPFRIFCIVIAASLFGVIPNLSDAEPASDWQNGMGLGMMSG